MEIMITTADNPFDPFDEYDQWFQWDMIHGYNTPGLLARVAVTSDALSDADQSAALDDAIQEIVDNNVTGLYVKVQRET